MRFAAAVLASVATALAGCSSSTPPPATQSDAGDEYRALGQSCDPASPHPCEVLTDGCSASACQSDVCVRVFVDAGPTCSNGSPPSYDGGEGGEDGGQQDGGEADAGQRSDASADAGDAAAPVDASDAAAGDAEADASFDASGD